MTEWTASDLIDRWSHTRQDELRLRAIEQALIQLDALPDGRRHPWYLQIYLGTDHFGATFNVRGHGAIDLLLDEMFAHGTHWDRNPSMYVLPAVKPLPHGAIDNQLRLNFDADAEVGAIMYNMVRGGTPGTWWT